MSKEGMALEICAAEGETCVEINIGANPSV
jgi:hypothetical protein